ncbi:MAG TPA: hypothetical protein VFH54_07020 [Mycobacteriales bacterium]|nr:hypothetical protein [Mycobacteriales bacterium]
MGLRLVADAAYPFDYSKLPAGVGAVAGYVGGDTPHVWTPAEIAAVKATGRQWWGIWTAPSTGEVLTSRQGSNDGADMASALNRIGYPKTLPVFYDIEQGTWNASPAGARAAISAWKTALHAAGWASAYAYVPLAAGFDWIADWTGRAPETLPTGVIGQQWAGNQDGDTYDLSSFTDTLFGDDMALTAAEASELANAATFAAAACTRAQALQAQVAELQAAVAALAKQVSGIQTGGVDPVALAQAIAAHVKLAAD